MIKLAADIVLLPPKDIMQICIDLNKQECSVSFQDINLEDNLPHISLAMGVLDINDLERAKETLDKFSNNFPSLELELTELRISVMPNGKKSCAFKVGITPELQKLHNQIVKNYSDILTHNDVNIEMFYADPGELMDKVSCYWVETYPKKSFENFDPHISLKCENANYTNLPITFKINILALSQLGNFCTCRKILNLVKLNKF